MILPVLGVTLIAISLGLLVCLGVALASPGEHREIAFALPAGLCLALAAGALAVARRRPEPERIRPVDGYLAVTLAWVVAAAVGMLPFLLQGTFDRPASAFFESMSGFTTTGSTLLSGIDEQPQAILLWRSIMQWLGGVGIVVLVVAIVPVTGLASQRFFYAEVTGPTTERLTPRIADTARIIVGIYLVLSVAGVLAYGLAGMDAFDAINHSMTSIATAGYSTHDASLGHFDSLAIEIVAIVLMVMGGVNFALYWRALRGERSLFPQLAEVRAYLTILIASILLVGISLWGFGDLDGLGGSMRESAVNVVSIMTTTGYTTADFDLWNDFARMGLLLLMFVGGCAGSTAGGMKVIRIMLLGRSAAQEVRRQLQPSAVQVLRIRGRVYPEEVRRGIFGFVVVWVLVFAAATVALTAMGVDLLTSTSGVAATLNVIGPGMGEVGASETFAALPEGGLWLLSACMLLGRLEIFTVLALLVPLFAGHRARRGR